jgi:predicted XRE-type DNA-binding protein
LGDAVSDHFFSALIQKRIGECIESFNTFVYCGDQCEIASVNNMTIQEMLAELLRSGLSQRVIADRVGTTQPTINRAAKGADVRYVTGKAIECLYTQEKEAADLKSAA